MSTEDTIIPIPESFNAFEISWQMAQQITDVVKNQYPDFTHEASWNEKDKNISHSITFHKGWLDGFNIELDYKNAVRGVSLQVARSSKLEKYIFVIFFMLIMLIALVIMAQEISNILEFLFILSASGIIGGIGGFGASFILGKIIIPTDVKVQNLERADSVLLTCESVAHKFVSNYIPADINPQKLSEPKSITDLSSTLPQTQTNTQTPGKKCECCGQIKEGGFHKFYYGRSLSAHDKKESPTQQVKIGGSKSVYLCSRCLRKGFIEDPQVSLMLIVFVITFIGMLIISGAAILGIIPRSDSDTLSPWTAIFVLPFVFALSINLIAGYFIFDGYFGFLDRFQTIKASDNYKKELAKQGFDNAYSPKRYNGMLQNGLCQIDPSEKEEAQPETLQKKTANQPVSTKSTSIDKSIDPETQKKEDANICPRCQGDYTGMLYCKECGYTNKSSSLVIASGVLVATGIGVQGLFAAFSQNATLEVEIAKMACCGGPGIIFAIWSLQEVFSRENYENWKQHHSQEMDKLVEFYIQNPTNNTEEIAQFMNRKPRWVEFMLEEMEKAGRITRRPQNGMNDNSSIN